MISLGQWLASFSHRFSFQVELVRAVHESVEDGVGEGRIPDDVVPVPRLALELAKLGTVAECTGADTAAWRNNARLPKAHWVDALCAATRENASASTSGRPLEISTTGRGRRLVVKRNASGFPRRKKDRRIVDSHRETPPHGLRAGDAVRGKKPTKTGQLVRGTLSTARHDGRCTVKTRAGARINCMARTLTLVHRGTGAHIQ